MEPGKSICSRLLHTKNEVIWNRVTGAIVWSGSGLYFPNLPLVSENLEKRFKLSYSQGNIRLIMSFEFFLQKFLDRFYE